MLKFSAGGFRDFTRIASSDPTMWRDIFLANKDAVLEMLGRFSEDVSELTRAIRRGDGDALFDIFTERRAIRRSIVEIGQDSPAPDFGRPHPGSAGASRCRGPMRHEATRLRLEQTPCPSRTRRSSASAISRTHLGKRRARLPAELAARLRWRRRTRCRPRRAGRIAD